MDQSTAALRALFAHGVSVANPLLCVPPLLPAPPKGRTVVLAAGKAAAAMAQAVENHWQGPLEGIAVTRYGHGLPCRHVEVIEAGHPVPDSAGQQAASRMLALAQTLGPDDLVLSLISGGGSALLALPAGAIPLSAKQAINRQLLASGAPISEMNVLRKHLSAIKGGRLAQAASPAQIVTIGISDVAGDDISVIASGPTVPDASTLAQARAILGKYNITIPDIVRQHLFDPKSETPKPGSPCFARSSFHLAARPHDMVEAVAKAAAAQGFHVVNLGCEVEGEARDVGRNHAQLALKLAAERRGSDKPILILSGGETTVTVTQNGGKGGRNLEYLLAFSLAVAGTTGISALACDTDGFDGTEDNAGGVMTSQTLERAQKAGVDPDVALARHCAYSVFEAAGDLVITGATLTNVNDLRLILIG